jgi:hypothetical protein
MLPHALHYLGRLVGRLYRRLYLLWPVLRDGGPVQYGVTYLRSSVLSRLAQSSHCSESSFKVALLLLRMYHVRSRVVRSEKLQL